MSCSISAPWLCWPSRLALEFYSTRSMNLTRDQCSVNIRSQFPPWNTYQKHCVSFFRESCSYHFCRYDSPLAHHQWLTLSFWSFERCRTRIPWVSLATQDPNRACKWRPTGFERAKKSFLGGRSRRFLPARSIGYIVGQNQPYVQEQIVISMVATRKLLILLTSTLIQSRKETHSLLANAAS